MTPELTRALERFARHEIVVVASDFDGVLAPLVDDPMASRALPGDLEALRAMATMPRVHVALVSGRDLETLLTLTGVDPAADDIVVFGSHGAQSSDDAVAHLDPDQRAALDRLDTETCAHVDEHPGARVEHKPAARVVHTRGMPAGAARASTDALLARVETLDGVHVLRGKDVVELAVLETSKGAALATFKESTGADAVLYLGDDTTDETVFVRLGPDDVGVKVGDGDTAAEHRVADPEAVTRVLERLRTELARTH